MIDKKLICKDLSHQKWREYEFNNTIYRIKNPKKLFFKQKGTTHRIVDENNVVHCLPCPGINGCVLRWKNKDKNYPVCF